ncbi:MAG: BACON domain-containing protein, partial [Rikenellaceae bacterium]
MAKLKTTVVESTEDTTATQAATLSTDTPVSDQAANEPAAIAEEEEATGDGEAGTGSEPNTEIEPTLSLNITTKSVNEGSGSFTVNVTSNSDWTTEDVPNWLTLTPSEGSGNTAVKVAYSANESYTDRSKTFSFKAGELTQTLKVTQSASIEPTLTLSVKTKSVSETAGSFNVNITSNSDWTTSNVPSWITLTPAQGSGDTAVKVTYTANTAYTQRSKSITFSVGDLTQTLTVTQGATPEPDPEPEGDEPDDFADQILKCFPKEELMYIDRQGGLYVQNTEE